MMKKFLVLMLVFGMASLANAVLIDGVDWTFDGWQLIGEGTVLGTYDVMISYQNGADAFGQPMVDGIITPDTTVDDDGVYDAAGSAGSIADFFGMINVYSDDGAVAGSQVLGDWFVFRGDGGTIPSYLHFWADGNYASPIGSIPIYIPEPVTMALLGIGGLFLRRRRYPLG